MADYTQNEDYSTKDGLSTGDPEKLILGSDIDSELAEIQTAVASKYDSSDIASQAQAEALSSNAVLMTPLRVGQALGLSTGSAGTAGAIADILALNDPGGDRILFWDDSDNAVEWLTVGTGLTLTGNTLSADDANIDHDSLSGFVANEHIDHTTITITAGEGLSYSVGGTDISADSTIDLDANGLTAFSGSFDETNDQVIIYDDSNSDHRKVNVGELIGDALGDGKWYRTSSNQTITTSDADLVYNAEDYDSLQKGTFNTSTGIYTNGGNASRVWVHAQVRFHSLEEGDTANVKILKNSTVIAAALGITDDGFGAIAHTITATTSASLAASDTIKVQVSTTNTNDAAVTGVSNTYLSIMELA